MPRWCCWCMALLLMYRASYVAASAAGVWWWWCCCCMAHRVTQFSITVALPVLLLRSGARGAHGAPSQRMASAAGVMPQVYEASCDAASAAGAAAYPELMKSLQVGLRSAYCPLPTMGKLHTALSACCSQQSFAA